MRRKDKKLEDPEEIEDILKSGTICRIALSDDNVPYLLPMNYGYRDNCLYLHSAREGRKIDILAKNPAVCFEITDSVELKEADTACEYSAGFRSLIASGQAEFLINISEKMAALQIIMQQQTGRSDWELSKNAIDMVTVLKIPIESISAKRSK